ncbi:universal stress protein [Desulfohalovibrio reitneri]|uniref:universal stress protein n=1 Tax=Desulfohalovibrio reitneri TaxID=1307759 RepID=UPI0004A71327|nr:universal stress protein [Desulfohalovibrio reitneri]
MKRKLLVTVGREKGAPHGARFICDFFSDKEGLELTLYYTAPRPASSTSLPDYEERAELDRIAGLNARHGRAALARARSYLTSHGFPGDALTDKLHFRGESTAMDIVREGERGLYDAVVLGSRGVGWLESLVESSVSRDILDKRLTIPLWLCRRPEAGRRNVLACVDDSEQSFRMIDHVGFMLSQEPGQNVTLLNVFDPGSGDRIIAEELFARCGEILHSHGLAPERIGRRVIESRDPAKSILREADRQRHSVVAAGRTGADRGLVKRLFMGSVSSTLYSNLTGAVLWLVQ